MNVLREELRHDLKNNDKEYRHAYADESLNATIATQIKVLREQRDWRQGDLASEAQMTQPMVSRYENVNYSSWSLKTLKKFAWAYDCWLDVRFRSFGELVTSTDEFGRKSLEVPKFDDDPFFMEVSVEQSKSSSVSNIVAAVAGNQPIETTQMVHLQQPIATARQLVWSFSELANQDADEGMVSMNALATGSTQVAVGGGYHGRD
jgi:transcriptional regulator with XRE-family HTH domain